MKSRVIQISLMVMLAIFVQVWAVSAQVRDGQVQDGNEQGLVGSWNLTVTLRSCQNPQIEFVSFPAMNTYNQGGTTQQTAVPGPDGPALPGHGAWSHQTGRNYSGAFQFFGLNPAGTYAVRVIVRSTIRLGRSGDDYTSTDTAEILNTNGDLLFRSCSTSTATRFR